jgi:hypothetical protein
MTGPQHPIPTAKGRAYVTWRDAPDRDHDDDDEPIVAFSAGWEARDAISVVTHVTDRSDSTEPSLETVLTTWYTDEARGTHLDFDDLPSLVKRIEAHYASVQPPTREQIAEAIRHSDWDSLGNWAAEPERIKDDYRKNADAVLALFPQSTPMQECGVCGRHYPASDTRSTCPVCWPGFGEYGQQAAPIGVATERDLYDRYLDSYPVDAGVPSSLSEWRQSPAEPASIADMAPGTTFVAFGVRWTVNAHHSAVGPAGLTRGDIDPSTIRDVTPPPATPEKG